MPGLLTGATLGLATPGASVEHEVRLERIQAWTSLGIAAVAWPLSTLIPTDQGWALVMAHDTAVAVTISAILGTLIDLLPFAAFPGGLLKEHARWSWAGLTAITWTAFMAFVMPQSRYWLDVGDHVGRWITVAAVAMVAGIAVVMLLHRRDVRARAAAAA
ncbi:hypothetical protein FHP29_18750 [Nocardioides albidus]|uniref:Uncharacterized protein n=1 Tax=Nocardioides albidus TaxID=1517589 RepID=A0A5C4VK54_9ACTN|nr:hypothetical protein FHP29_18750 [Nocardioides albidus]